MNDLQIEYFLAAARRNMSFPERHRNCLYHSLPSAGRSWHWNKNWAARFFERLNRGIMLTANGEMFYDFF